MHAAVSQQEVLQQSEIRAGDVLAVVCCTGWECACSPGIVDMLCCPAPALRSAEDGNERDDLKGSCTACLVIIDSRKARATSPRSRSCTHACICVYNNTTYSDRPRVHACSLKGSKEDTLGSQLSLCVHERRQFVTGKVWVLMP